MQSETLSTEISTSLIQAQLAQFLQAFSAIPNHKDIVSIEFPKSVNLNQPGTIPIKIHFKSEGVTLQKIDGEGGKKL